MKKVSRALAWGLVCCGLSARLQPAAAAELLSAETRRGLAAAAAAAAASVVREDPLASCFEVPGSLCLLGDQGTSFSVASRGVPRDLAIWYQFDKNLPVDESGHWRHLTDASYQLTPVPVGPGVMGRGASAAFDGSTYRMLQAKEVPTAPTFTVAFWIYLLGDSVGTWHTIFARAVSPEEFGPALLLWPNERRLHVRLSPHGDGGSLDGVGRLPLRRWTHVAVVFSSNVLRLFVNGLKDSEVILDETPAAQGGDFFLGRDPWRAGAAAYLDDFRWYTRDLSAAEVRALAIPSLTGIAGDSFQLGCSSCKFTEALRSCGHGSHLCYPEELQAGGLHAARVMGWFNTKAEVWDGRQPASGDDAFSGVEKVALCCAD